MNNIKCRLGLNNKYNRRIHEVVREIGKDLIENVSLMDKFSKTGKTSLAYRITYRSNDRTLLNSEINEMQENIRNETAEKLDIELR